MDDKHATELSRGVSGPSPIHNQPTTTDADTASPKVNSASEKSSAVESSAASAVKAEKPEPSRGVTEGFETSRVELDRLLAETEAIHESSWRIIHKLLQDSQLRASQTVDACLTRLEKEIPDRVRSEMSMALQNLDVEAGARLTARLDRALATAKQRQHSIEQDLTRAVDENRKQLDQISTGAAEELRLSEQNLLSDLRKEGEKLRADLAKNVSEISNNVQRLREAAAIQLKEYTEEAMQTYQSRIEQVWQEVVNRAKKTIAEEAHAVTIELGKQARQMVEREMSDFFSHALRRLDRSSEAQSSKQNS